MDLFAASLAGEAGPLRLERLHYHDFSRRVHENLHQRRQEGAAREAIRLIAGDIAEGCPGVLCLDEFQVTNITDAIILRQLFEAIFANGAMIVMTSNRPPEDLYKDGLNHFIYMPPFLRLLKEKVGICHLNSSVDYRVEKAVTEEVDIASRPDCFVTPAAAANLEATFIQAAGGPASRGTLELAWGRRVPCSSLHNSVASFSFEELCCSPLSADDYSAMIDKNALHTFILSDVPRFTVEQHNEARRFTNLVDCLYERQCRLYCSMEAPLEELMAEMEVLSHVPIKSQPAMGIAGSERSIRKHGDVTFEVSASSPCRPDTFATAEADAESGTSGGDELVAAIRAAKQHASGEGTAADPTSENGVSGVMSAALVSLQESGFAAKRCISRLREMGTAEYLAAHKLKWACT